MKKVNLKRALSFVVCVALCLAVLAPAYAANENNRLGVKFSVTLDTPIITANETEAQTVVMRLVTDIPVTVDGIGFNVTWPSAWTISSITGGDKLGAYAKTETVLSSGQAVWSAVDNFDSENVENVTELAVITFIIPAGTIADDYEVGVKNLRISKDYTNDEWETAASATTVLTIEEAGDDSGEDESDTTDPYTAKISANSAVANGENIEVKVNVGGTTGVFNSAEIVLDYDPAYLTYVSGATASTDEQIPDFEVNTTDGTVIIRDYGEEITAGNGVYTLTFTAAKGGNTNVDLTSAGFSTAERAEKFDLLPATGLNTLEVTINHKVTVNGSLAGSVAPTGTASYTVTIPDYDSNYNYTVSATVGGSPVTPVDNGNGTYTINNINGDVVVTYTKGEAKTYTVLWIGDFEDVDPMYTGITSATYGVPFTIALPENREATQEMEGVSYTATVSVGGAELYTLSGGQSYTIQGSAITDDIEINVVKTETPSTGSDDITVTVTGDAGVTIEGADGNSITVDPGTAVTLILTEETGYTYSVMVGSEGPVSFTDGKYTFEATESVTVTVTKTLDTSTAKIKKYLTLDRDDAEGDIYLLTIGTAKIDGKVYTYTENGNIRNMFWSDEYNAYCTLIIAAIQPEVSNLVGNIGLAGGTVVDVDYTMDVNMSDTNDVNDAQLVWNMYSVQYTGFTNDVTIEKYLRADVNGDATVNTNDAAAIITAIKTAN